MSASHEWVFPSCPECGARSGSTATRCWICHAALPGRKSDAPRRRTPSPPRTAPPNVFVPARNRSSQPSAWRDEQLSEETTTEQLTMFLLCFALIVVGIGLWTLMPGGAFFYVLVITPAMISIYVSLDRYISPENWELQDHSVARLISIVVKTFVVLWLLMIATGIALFISLWITCSDAMKHQFG